MSARLSRQRWWIAGLYCLAVVMAQGFHTHHAMSDGCSEAATGCGEERPESEGDVLAATAVESDSNECPSCEFTLSHQAHLSDRVGLAEAVRHTSPLISLPADSGTSADRPRSRGPPAC